MCIHPQPKRKHAQEKNCTRSVADWLLLAGVPRYLVFYFYFIFLFFSRKCCSLLGDDSNDDGAAQQRDRRPPEIKLPSLRSRGPANIRQRRPAGAPVSRIRRSVGSSVKKIDFVLCNFATVLFYLMQICTILEKMRNKWKPEVFPKSREFSYQDI